MLSSKAASIISRIQIIDQKDMTAVDKFFKPIDVTITREENTIRDATRDVTRIITRKEISNYVAIITTTR